MYLFRTLILLKPSSIEDFQGVGLHKNKFMKKGLTILALMIFQLSFGQIKDVKAIQHILNQQQKAWNEGDISKFMVGYWEHDSLVFMGEKGPQYGYQNTLKNYQIKYPNKDHMGELIFTIVSISPLNKDHYFVIGRYFLKRTVGDASGNFTLVFKKIKGEWKIISDHSS